MKNSVKAYDPSLECKYSTDELRHFITLMRLGAKRKFDYGSGFSYEGVPGFFNKAIVLVPKGLGYRMQWSECSNYITVDYKTEYDHIILKGLETLLKEKEKSK